MKFECVQEKLREAVGITEKITSKNLPLPVLGAIIISAEKKAIKLKATNLDVGIEYEIPARVEQTGIVAIPGHLFGGVISTLSAKEPIVKGELIGNNLNLVAGRSSVLVKTIKPDDFPRIPRINEGQSKQLDISAQDMVLGIRSVGFSASLSDVKPEIASVCIHQDGDSLVFVATDSFRLAEKTIKTKKGKMTGPEQVIIPVRNASEIIRVFDGESGGITVVASQNQITISSSGDYFTSRVVNGSFPDYKQAVPKGVATEATVAKEELTAALRLANIFSDKFNQVTIRIIPGEGLFEITSQSQDLGESAVKLDAVLSGEEVDSNFNSRYLADCLPAIPEENVTLVFNGKDKPLIIRGAGNGSFTYLVMPLHK